MFPFYIPWWHCYLMFLIGYRKETLAWDKVMTFWGQKIITLSQGSVLFFFYPLITSGFLMFSGCYRMETLVWSSAFLGGKKLLIHLKTIFCFYTPLIESENQNFIVLPKSIFFCKIFKDYCCVFAYSFPLAEASFFCHCCVGNLESFSFRSS